MTSRDFKGLQEASWDLNAEVFAVSPLEDCTLNIRGLPVRKRDAQNLG